MCKRKYMPGVVSVYMRYTHYENEDQFNYGTGEPEVTTCKTFLIDDVWVNIIDQHMAIQTNAGVFYIPYERDEDLNKLCAVRDRLNKFRERTETIGYGVKIYIDMVKDRIMNTKFVFTSREETLPSGEVVLLNDIVIHHWYSLNKLPPVKEDGKTYKKNLLVKQLGRYRDSALVDERVELNKLDDFIDFLLRLRHAIEKENK